MNRSNWEFTYTGSVLAEVTKKRIEEIECQIKLLQDHVKEKKESGKFDSLDSSAWLSMFYDYQKELREYQKWLFVFEKHPENKHDLDRDDFVYFFR